MATLFGSGVSNAVPPQNVNGPAHARSRFTLSTYDGTPASGDILIWSFNKSSDRLLDIQYFGDGNATAGNFDVGLYSVSFSNNAIALTAVDVDLFASAVAVTAAITYAERATFFTESTTLDDVMDRGKSLWELAAIGAASYTSDPGLTFAIAGTCTTTVNAANEMAVLVDYVAGD